MDYASELTVRSKSVPGVSFTIARVSFGGRLELTRKMRDLAGRIEFLEAGADPREKLEAAVLAGEIDRIYLSWGLRRVEGLSVDGREATPEAVIAAGPEALAREILEAIKAQCGLTDEERKNS